MHVTWATIAGIRSNDVTMSDVIIWGIPTCTGDSHCEYRDYIHLFNKVPILTSISEWLRCLGPKREVAGSGLCGIPINGLVWSLYKCAALVRAAMVLPQLKDALELLVMRKEFYISISLPYDLSC